MEVRVAPATHRGLGCTVTDCGLCTSACNILATLLVVAEPDLGIAIVYSFRDYDALTKLASASALNPRLTLIVVDPRAKDICQVLAQKGIRSVPVPQKFGEDIRFMRVVLEHAVKAARGGAQSETGRVASV